MKKIVLLAASILSLGVAGRAQMGYGVELGFNSSNYNVVWQGVTKGTEFRNGGRIGAMADMALNDNLFFQPGLFYVTSGYRTNIPGGYQQYTFSSLEVPLYLQYKIGMLGRNRVFLGAGPYFAVHTDGNVYLHSGSISSRADLLLGSKVGDQFRPIDFGAGINVGYQITQGLFLRLRSQMGILNTYPGPDADTKMKSYSFCVSAGYIFYSRDKSGRLQINRDRSKQQKKQR